MKIGIYGRVFKDKKSVTTLYQITHYLLLKGAEVYVYGKFYTYLREISPSPDSLKTFDGDGLKENDLDFLISMGGDGTMLDTLLLVKKTGIPVLGINFGRLGFLAHANADNWQDALEELFNSSYKLDKRTLVKLESNNPIFSDWPYALNDFVIHKKDTSSMVTVHTYLNGEFLNSYWADGLILATPTGSSGYSLSCGGPILFPKSSGFVLTPIAPHNLNVRPIVFSDDNVISFEVEGRGGSFLATLDSRSSGFSPENHLAIRKADFTFNMIKLSNVNFMTTLRNKMMWGLDNRNF